METQINPEVGPRINGNLIYDKHDIYKLTSDVVGQLVSHLEKKAIWTPATFFTSK